MAKYFQIWPSFWRGDRRRWSDDQKLLALYLLCCEHRSLEGYYFLPKGYIIADLPGWEMSKVDRLLGALVACGFCSYDEDAQVVFVVKALEHDAPKGPRRVTGAVKALRAVPASTLWPAFLEACATHAPELAEALAEVPDQSTDTPSEPYLPVGDELVDTPSEGHLYARAHNSIIISNNNSSSNDDETRDARQAKINEVCALLKSDVPFLGFDELSVLRLIERGERSDLAPLDLATSAIALARRYERDGTLRTSSVESLMRSILDRRETSASAQLAAAGARAVAEAEGRAPRSVRRASAEARAAERDRKAAELREQEQRDAA